MSKKIDKYKIPSYDRRSKLWKVQGALGLEEGSLEYVVSEYVLDCLYYPFSIGSRSEHVHGFEGVLEAVLEQPHSFSVSEYEEYYSKQELNLIKKLQDKLLKEIESND